MLSAKQTMEKLGVGRSTVLRLIERGELPAIDVSSGGKRATWRIREEDVEAFIARRTKAPEEPLELPRNRRRERAPITGPFTR